MSLLTYAFKALKVLQRNKVSVKRKEFGLLGYFEGLSLQSVGRIVGVAKQTVHYWFKKLIRTINEFVKPTEKTKTIK